MARILLLCAVALMCILSGVTSFAIIPFTFARTPSQFFVSGGHGSRSNRLKAISLRASLDNPVVVVAGATGRVGRLVVQELLNRNISGTGANIAVRALIRDNAKAQTTLPPPSSRLEILRCDLSNNDDVNKACVAASAVIWCATGFSDSSSILDKLAAIFKLKVMPKQSIDITALAAIGRAMKDIQTTELGGPRVVMCSSAGVTRTTWSEAKKQRYAGAADIPIVRLNPFGILDVKREAEEALRQSGATYCVVRPCGLNDNWPEGRPVMSQGDLAVGRMNRADVARLLVSMLVERDAAGVTLECIGLPGYPPPASFALQLSRLRKDAASSAIADGAAGEDSSELDGVYAVLQQLVPGERMQPNQLAMGQTYEQLDRGEQGRLGPRGAEAPPIVASN